MEQKKRGIVQPNMRKLLAIASLLFGLILAVFLLLPILLSVSGLDKIIADYFVDKFSQKNEKFIKFSEIDVGYHSIKLDNIQFVSQTAGINLEIRGLEFDYNLLDLVKNLKEPHKAIDRIYFVEPRIIIQENAEPEIQTLTPTDTSRLIISEFVNQFENIDRIHLKEGQIGIKKSSGEILMLAKNLEGWVNALDFSRVQLKAFGDLLYGTDKNFSIDCILNPREQEFRAQVGLKNFNIRHIRKIEDDNDFKIEHGVLDGQIELTGNKFKLDAITANGEFLLSDVKANLYNLNFTDLKIPVIVKNNSVNIESGSALLDGSSFTFKGQIANIFYPKLTGRLSSDELWLGSFSAYVDTSKIGNLSFKADASYKWSPDSYHIDSDIYAESISLQDQKINNTKINLCIRDGVLTIPKMNWETLGFPVIGSGRMDLIDGEYEVSLSTDKHVGNYVFLDQISGGHQFANISVHGNVLEKSLDGNWAYRVENMSDTIFAVSGITKLKDAVF